ncbi:hypothetical protein ACFLXF_00860 [Chloroflexota bacterium]
MRKTLARLASNILNPFLVSLVMVILLAFESASSLSDGLKWSFLALALSAAPILVIILYLVHSKKIEGIFIKAREQRGKVYLMASVFVALSCVVLFSLGAPLELLAAFWAALLAIIIYMAINLWWKISVHTGFVTGSITLLTILYGAIGLVAAVLLPLIAWSRVELEHHSPMQVTVGAMLAALIVVTVFRLFGLIG